MSHDAPDTSIRWFWPITALAAGLAVVLFLSGYPSLIYDSYGYFRLAQNLIADGLVGAANESRTYGYPLFVAICCGFLRPPPEVVRLLVFVVQLVLYLAACAAAARSFARAFPRRGMAAVFYASAVLNPVLLARTTEVLTDLLSAVLVLLAVVLSVDPARARRPVASAAGALLCAGLAAMVRPASVTIFAAIVLLTAARTLLTKSLPARALPVLLAVALLPFVPQLAINRRAYGKVEPLIVAKLYRDQTVWGMANLKYATAVIPGQPPEITYSNPPYRGDPSPGAFLRRDPIGYVATLGIHLFAMFDPDFLFTYVTDLHPGYRWPLSAMNLVFLALAGWGVLLAWRPSSPRETRFAAAVIVFASMLYVSIHLPIAVESRFSVPVELLLTPFFAIALLRVADLWRSGRRGALVKAAAATVAWVGFGLVLSGWIAAQAPRLAGQSSARSVSGSPPKAPEDISSSTSPERASRRSISGISSSVSGA